jgi:hypothetical protein
VDIDLINNLKYQILEKYKSVEDQKKINKLICILGNLEKKIKVLKKEINSENNS